MTREIDILCILLKIEYEISTEENYLRSGVLQLNVNGTAMDVKFFVNKNGFHVADLQKQVPQQQQPITGGVQRPFGPLVVPQRGAFPQGNNAQFTQQQQQQSRSTRQQQQQQSQGKFLNPTFSRPDLLTGQRSIQPGR